MKKFLLSLLVLIFIVVGFLVHRAYLFVEYQNPQTTLVDIQLGTSLRELSRQLQQNQVIQSAYFFEGLTRWKKYEQALKAGEFEFTAGLSPLEVLHLIVRGESKQYPLTIPEGYSLAQIGQVFQKRFGLTALEWAALVAGEGVAEGYLFPDTYLLTKNAAPKEVIQRMKQTLKKKLTQEMLAQAESQGLTLHEWLTLASIIEKETGAGTDRPVVAQVFLTRLKKGMLLQTDPTVIYGIANFNGNLTKQDLLTDTPYNTYTRPGLPPGPICSPGLESLRAVLNPAPTSYLYFVGKGDGTHYFSETLAQHNWAVQYYQKKMGQPPPDDWPE